MAVDLDIHWYSNFTDRERKEIEFSELYAENYNHGTDGHNAKLIIAKLVGLLRERENRIDKALVELGIDAPNALPYIDRIASALHGKKVEA